jgi:prophage antirepressor-like protein
MGEVVSLYNFKGNDIRVVNKDGQAWFVAKDVCDVLGYARSNDAVTAHCKHSDILKYGEIPYLEIPPRGLQIIPESDLYRLIMRSNMFEAEMFQAWVTEEVLPEIRQTGGYIQAEDGDTDEMIMARAVLAAQRTIERLKEKVKTMEPLVERYKMYMESDGLINLQNVGRILGYRPNKFIGVMRARGWLSTKRSKLGFRNDPMQKYLQMGYFAVKVIDGPVKAYQTFLTKDGLMWIVEMIKNGSLFIPPEYRLAK